MFVEGSGHCVPSVTRPAFDEVKTCFSKCAVLRQWHVASRTQNFVFSRCVSYISTACDLWVRLYSSFLFQNLSSSQRLERSAYVANETCFALRRVCFAHGVGGHVSTPCAEQMPLGEIRRFFAAYSQSRALGMHYF